MTYPLVDPVIYAARVPTVQHFIVERYLRCFPCFKSIRVTRRSSFNKSQHSRNDIVRNCNTTLDTPDESLIRCKDIGVQRCPTATSIYRRKSEPFIMSTGFKFSLKRNSNSGTIAAPDVSFCEKNVKCKKKLKRSFWLCFSKFNRRTENAEDLASNADILEVQIEENRQMVRTDIAKQRISEEHFTSRDSICSENSSENDVKYLRIVKIPPVDTLSLKENFTLTI